MDHVEDTFKLTYDGWRVESAKGKPTKNDCYATQISTADFSKGVTLIEIAMNVPVIPRDRDVYVDGRNCVLMTSRKADHADGHRN